VQQAAGSETREGVVIDPEETIELKDTRNGTANFVINFGGGQTHLTFIEPKDKELEKKKIKLRGQTSSDKDMVPILAMECRGIEPVKWYPTGPYRVETEGGATFDDVNLDEGDDWCEYDEKSGESLTVGKNIKYEFRRA
jgi:hypothetical protein